MSLSSLQKTATTSKSLVFIFLVGLLSLTFLVLIVNKVFAATAAPTAPTSTSAVGIQTITYNWTAPAAFSGSKWILASSTNRVPSLAQQIALTPTSTVTFAFIGLATNTAYYLGAAGGDAVGATSSFATSSLVYTLAAQADAPTASVPNASSMLVVINPATNPTNTTFAIYNTSTGNFLDAAGAASVAPVWQTTSSWGSAFAASGLTANTAYQFVVVARNGDGIAAATSSASTAVYTLSSAPSSLAVSAGANGFTASWSGNSTEYYAEDITAGTNSGWITGTSFSVNGVNCGTTHSFRVKGRNGALVETSFSDSVDGTTNACGSAAIAVPAIPATPATPAVPGVSPAIPATPATPASPASGNVSGSLPSSASPVAVFVHTLRVGQNSNEVKQLQQKLRELGYFTYPTNTGYFGGVTRAAVVAFQKAMGLKPFPGHVGPATRAALNNL